MGKDRSLAPPPFLSQAEKGGRETEEVFQKSRTAFYGSPPLPPNL